MTEMNPENKTLHNIFRSAPQGALSALKRPLPIQAELADKDAIRYAEIALANLRQTQAMPKVGWVSFMNQGLRLLFLEKLFMARGLHISPEMSRWLREIKATPEIVATLKREGLRI